LYPLSDKPLIAYILDKYNPMIHYAPKLALNHLFSDMFNSFIQQHLAFILADECLNQH
jgi:hypothetical protein